MLRSFFVTAPSPPPGSSPSSKRAFDSKTTPAYSVLCSFHSFQGYRAGRALDSLYLYIQGDKKEEKKSMRSIHVGLYEWLCQISFFGLRFFFFLIFFSICLTFFDSFLTVCHVRVPGADKSTMVDQRSVFCFAVAVDGLNLFRPHHQSINQSQSCTRAVDPSQKSIVGFTIWRCVCLFLCAGTGGGGEGGRDVDCWVVFSTCWPLLRPLFGDAAVLFVGGRSFLVVLTEYGRGGRKRRGRCRRRWQQPERTSCWPRYRDGLCACFPFFAGRWVTLAGCPGRARFGVCGALSAAAVASCMPYRYVLLGGGGSVCALSRVFLF